MTHGSCKHKTAVPDDEPLDERSRAIERIVRTLPRIMGALFSERLMTEEAELTIPQIRTLSALQCHSRRTMGELAEALGVSLPSATQIVDRLVRRGLVERSPDAEDRRVVRVSLTETGASITQEARRERDRQLQAASRYLSPEELTLIADALARLLAAVRRSKSEQTGDPS